MIDKEKLKILPSELTDKTKVRDAYHRINTIAYKIWEESKQNNEEIIGRSDRLVSSEISELITYRDTDVGFIYATPEYRYNEGLFIDMAILNKYRGYGIGRAVLEKVVSRYKGDKYLIGEVKKDNEASNTISEIYGVKIPFDNDELNTYNYYLFPKSRLSEFLENNKDNKFQKAMENDTVSSAAIISEIKKKINE